MSLAVEGKIGDELIGGMVHEMNVSYIISDLKLPPVGSKEVCSSKPSFRLASSTLPRQGAFSIECQLGCDLFRCRARRRGGVRPLCGGPPLLSQPPPAVGRPGGTPGPSVPCRRG